MPGVSFAVTAFREMGEPRRGGRMLFDCIEAALAHPGIDEVVVVNDGSPDFAELVTEVSCWPLSHPNKLRLLGNDTNLGVFTNKIEAVAQARGEWVITCDSDNVMDAAYIDRALAVMGNPNTWYCPSFAKPNFDYRSFIGRWDAKSIGKMLTMPVSHCAVNTGNQTVCREPFLDVFGKYRGVRRFDLMMPNYADISHEDRQSETWWLSYGACDSFLFNIHWMLSSPKRGIRFVEGLEYKHHVFEDRSGSNYDRAPKEKGVLNGALVEMMKSRATEP